MAGHCRVYSTTSAAAAATATASSDSFFLSGASSAFLGSRSMLSFNDVSGSKRPFYQSFEVDEFGEEDLDEYLHQPEKKRRLTVDQVRFLEKSFEEDNKLEPDRKVQLAKDLGLQPRQIAIWFQNRRARWKTKQLEKDYEVLQASYNSLAADYEKLLKEKDVLKSEVSVLSEKVLLKEKEGESSKVENNFVSEGEVSKISTKSDVLDSDSPHYYNDACLDSSYGLEPDQSDLSQDEDDSLRKGLGADTYVFPKFEDPNTNLASNSCNVGLDHAAFWSWSY